MKHFIYVAVLLHFLASMIGALGCLLGNQLGLSLAFLIMSFLFFIIARGIEVLQ